MRKQPWLSTLVLVVLFATCNVRGWSYGASGTQQLVPATFQVKTDKLGFSWNIDTNGRIQHGTGRVFSGCSYLQVNGNGFSASSANARLMSRDGSEYFLTQSLAGVTVTRRVKVDAASSTVRFVEIFENQGTSPLTLTVTLGTSLQVTPQSAITDKGNPVQLMTAAGTPFIGADETGIVAYRPQGAATPYGVQPSVLFYLAGSGAKVRPSRNNSGNNQSYVFLYKLVVPPKKKAAILHGVAQRNFRSQPKVSALSKQFQVFQSSRWTRDLPLDIRRSIVNVAVSSSNKQPGVDVLLAASELADAWSVESDDKDVLVLDQDTQISGSLAGKSVSVTTEFGEASLPITEIAAIVGASGEGRPTRVYLRTGEILVGSIRFEALRFNSDADLQFELQPEQLNVVFTRAEPKDKPPRKPDSVALLKTRRGDRLALSNLADLKLSLVTAFGPLRVPLTNVRSGVVSVSPQPVHRLVLKDGSQLSALVRLSELPFETRRFGTQTIQSSMIAEFVQLENPATANPEQPEALFKLSGENVMAGKPVANELMVATAAGEMPVLSSQIRSMTSLDRTDGVSPIFAFEMADGSKFEGRLASSLIPIKSLERQWQIPVAQISSFEQPDPRPALARRFAAEFESLEVNVVAEKLKGLADEKKMAVAAMTLMEMDEEKAKLVLEGAKKLDAAFGKELAASLQELMPDEQTTVEEKKGDKPPTPTAADTSKTTNFEEILRQLEVDSAPNVGGQVIDPFGSSVVDPFGNDPFGNSP